MRFFNSSAVIRGASAMGDLQSVPYDAVWGCRAFLEAKNSGPTGGTGKQAPKSESGRRRILDRQPSFSSLLHAYPSISTVFPMTF